MTVRWDSNLCIQVVHGKDRELLHFFRGSLWEPAWLSALRSPLLLPDPIGPVNHPSSILPFLNQPRPQIPRDEGAPLIGPLAHYAFDPGGETKDA